MENKKQLVKEAIIKAVPSLIIRNVIGHMVYKSPTLADVLVAIRSGYAVTALGDFIEVHNGGAWEFPGTTTIYKWDLSQDFDHQSEAFYLFAWELLVNNK